MASTIKTKNGTGGASPGSLSQGELAINIDNGLVYFGSSSNAVRKLDTFLHITASVSGGIGGNISASGTIVSTGNITTGGDIISSGFISSSQFEGIKLFPTESHTSIGTTAQGDIVKFGSTTTTAGQVYMLASNGGWTDADASNNLASTGSLAISIGTNATTHGMLLRGMVKLKADPECTIGMPVYLSTAAGRGACTAPTDNNEIARVLGFYISGSGVIYFNPDNTSIQVSA